MGKSYSVACCFLLFLGFVSNVGIASGVPSLPEIEAAIEAGNLAILDDLSENGSAEAMERLVSVITLQKRTSSGRLHPEVTEYAFEALRSAEGHGMYIGYRIEQMTLIPSTYRRRHFYFQLLAELGTVEALEVIGEYLFDDRIAESPELLAELHASPEHPLDSGPNAFIAGVTLFGMGLPDAPPYDYTNLDSKGIEEWREWWYLNKGKIEEFARHSVLGDPLSRNKGEAEGAPGKSGAGHGGEGAGPSAPIVGTALDSGSSGGIAGWVFAVGVVAIVIVIALVVTRFAGRSGS